MPKSTYVALSAKVRAMYGGHMTQEDYRLLMEKKTLEEAAAFLKAHRGYSRGLAALHSGRIHREDLENALRQVYFQEYQRIFSFLSMEDKALLQFPIYQAEQTAILAAMRRLSSQHMLEPESPKTLEKKSQLDLNLLGTASSFSDIVSAASKTIFGSTLERSAAQGETPTPAFVDNMMQVTYYGKLYKVLSAHYSGDTKKILKQALDEKTDLLNLVQFLRLKKHFSHEDVQRYSFPLPCSSRLKKDYVQQLLSAPDYEAALSLVYSGPYEKLFRSIDPSGLEAYLYTLQYQFSRRQLRAAVPTIYTPIAYLCLKEIELRNIISIIECIRYKISPEAYVTLIGISAR